jgi:ammonia channel protein AmtB
VAASVLCGAYSFVASAAILAAVNLVTPVVPSREQLRAGLDASLHGECSVDSFTWPPFT